jgi:serine/threonine-protein kinase
MEGRLITFLRVRDYKLIKELGQGGCGKTVLLYDEIIDEYLVCKKYKPQEHRDVLYSSFLKEIKLLSRLYHRNIVRYYSSYVFPDKALGYILMEFVNGMDIRGYIGKNPALVDDVFQQVVSGFVYLEKSGVLHRDIRPANILVGADSVVKIIDLGFGKKVVHTEDFDKSISLNWCCEAPAEFDDDVYDYCTEVYFVGKLFDSIIKELHIDSFSYAAMLEKMCKRDPSERIAKFSDVEKNILTRDFNKMDFLIEDRRMYMRFAEHISKHLKTVYQDIRYVDDVEKLKTALESVYSKVSLEDYIPDCQILLDCFVYSDGYTYSAKGFPVDALRDFLQLLEISSAGQRRVILSNLHTRLDAVSRRTHMDDVPF